MTHLVTLSRINHPKLKTKILLTLLAITYITLQIPHITATFVEMEKTHTPEKMDYHCNELLQFNITKTVRTIKGGARCLRKETACVYTRDPYHGLSQ